MFMCGQRTTLGVAFGVFPHPVPVLNLPFWILGFRRQLFARFAVAGTPKIHRKAVPACRLLPEGSEQQIAPRPGDRRVLLAFHCKVSAGLKRLQVRRAWSRIRNIKSGASPCFSYLFALPALPTGHEAFESHRWLLMYLHFHLLGL